MRRASPGIFRLKADGPQSTSCPAVPATDANLSLLKKASQIVHQDMLNSPLGARARVAVSDQLDTDVPDIAEFVTKEFPATHQGMLVGCIGKGHLCLRFTGDR